MVAQLDPAARPSRLQPSRIWGRRAARIRDDAHGYRAGQDLR